MVPNLFRTLSLRTLRNQKQGGIVGACTGPPTTSHMSSGQSFCIQSLAAFWKVPYNPYMILCTYFPTYFFTQLCISTRLYLHILMYIYLYTDIHIIHIYMLRAPSQAARKPGPRLQGVLEAQRPRWRPLVRPQVLELRLKGRRATGELFGRFHAYTSIHIYVDTHVNTYIHTSVCIYIYIYISVDM